MHWRALLLIVAVTLAACSTDHHRTTGSTTSTPKAPPAESRVPCATPSRFGVSGATNEVRGASADASVWGLALGPGHIPPRAGDELKIVWRMTGTGPLRVTVAAPDGTPRSLVFGPEPHGASSFDRPGDEWGTGIRFDTAGCWRIHLARSDTSGDAWLDVAR